MSERLAAGGCVALLLAMVIPGQARQGVPPPSLQRRLQPLAAVKQVVLPPTDPAAEKAADARQAGKGPGPVRFAVSRNAQVTPSKDGTWEETPEGRVWRVRILSAGATDLNFGFTSFHLAEGVTLHITSESELYYQGPYTAEDNRPHGELWSALVPGPAAVVEVFVPAGAAEPDFRISLVGTGYRDWFGKATGVSIPKAGACNIDVVCPIAQPWTNQIRSVAVYTLKGAWTCSGTLIANANPATPFRNFFLTADHCSINADNASSVVVYWNFQSPTCGMLGGGSLGQNQSGAIFRASEPNVDMALIELEEIPEPSFQVYYSGWDRSGAAVASAVGIHHPNADEKAISFSMGGLTTGNSCIGLGVKTHWLVTWAQGVTEPGSSGSGLFDGTSKRLVGTLSGGDSDCANLSGVDCYGKFSVAWTNGASAAERLKEWLDPLNSGVLSVNGTDPMNATILAPAGWLLVAEGCAPGNGAVDPNEPVTVSFALRNYGGLPATNLVATLLTNGGITVASAPQVYGVVNSGSTVTQPFSFAANVTCGQPIQATLQLQDGARNFGNITFSIPTATRSIVYTQNFDSTVVGQLPAGWTTGTSSGPDWSVTGARSDSSPNSAFAANVPFVSDKRLTSPTITVPGTKAQLEFHHLYELEDGFDGGALEISIGGGAFQDILSAGGSFVSGGYNDMLALDFGNPLGGRSVWTGISSGFETTIVNLPDSAAGATIRLRWRLGSDDSTAEIGWYVDSIKISTLNTNCCSYVAPTSVRLENTRLVPPSSMAFSFNTETARSYVIEAASTVTGSWQAVKTNPGTGTAQSYTNTTLSPNQRFFRVLSR